MGHRDRQALKRIWTERLNDRLIDRLKERRLAMINHAESMETARQDSNQNHFSSFLRDERLTNREGVAQGKAPQRKSRCSCRKGDNDDGEGGSGEGKRRQCSKRGGGEARNAAVRQEMRQSRWNAAIVR